MVLLWFVLLNCEENVELLMLYLVKMLMWGLIKWKVFLYSCLKYVLRFWRNENDICLLICWGGSKIMGYLEEEIFFFLINLNGLFGVILEVWIEFIFLVKKCFVVFLRNVV